MKFKILGYVFLGLVLAAIVSLTLLYEVNHNTSYEPVANTGSDLRTYTAPTGDFQVNYPKQDFLVQPPTEGLTYFKDAQTPDVEVHVPMSAFPNTNFAESYVVVGTDASIKNAADCKTYNSNGNSQKTTDKTQTINGNTFDSAEITGAAAGNIYDTRLFRVFHGGVCYEISATLHTTNIQNYPDGAVSEVNADQAWAELMQIVNSFKFTSNQPASTQDGTLRGHVDVGPLCAGPQHQDQPCKNKADYSQTHVLIYDLAGKLLQTVAVDTAGNYSVELSSGNYSLNYQSNYGLMEQHASQSFTITSGKTTTLNINIDTGIR